MKRGGVVPRTSGPQGPKGPCATPPQTHSLHICSSHQGLMSDVIAYTLVQSQDIKPVSHKLGHSSQVWLPHELLHGKARLEQVGLLIPHV